MSTFLDLLSMLFIVSVAIGTMVTVIVLLEMRHEE